MAVHTPVPTVAPGGRVPPSPDQRLISYRTLRKLLGWIGIALPFVLVLGKQLVQGGTVRGSLSAYYHTDVRDLFVGALCTMAAFLVSYRGVHPTGLQGLARLLRDEYRVTNVAGAAALGVALFPTTPKDPTDWQTVAGRVHVGCAAVLFAALALMAYLFAASRTPEQLLDRHRETKRRIYLACSWLIAGSMVLMAVSGPVPGLAGYRPMLVLESVAVIAFGISWLVRGLEPVAAGPAAPAP